MEINSLHSATLNPSQIRILNWNIQKQSNPLWRRDIRQLSCDVDLAMFQEVHLAEPFLSCFDDSWCHSFARGYSTWNRQTGVVTLASAQHLSHQPIAICEPLIRIPKATNVTTYGLLDYERPLLVVNLHAINFSFGINSYHLQLQQIEKILNAHDGPVIFAGDFNAWHPKRIKLLLEFAKQLKLLEVPFAEDFRKQVFGRHLDYVFIRDLRINDAQTQQVMSSDHNPMLATLSVE
ncbi:MAG: endonuclease/exonuclease/phosphatase family protein [Pseudohongiellaceae bacterium]